MGERHPTLHSGDADGDRASKVQHAVQDMDGDVHLGCPTRVRARADPPPAFHVLRTWNLGRLRPSPITCLNLPMVASARARFVYPETFCQAARPCSAMSGEPFGSTNCRRRSRCVGGAAQGSGRAAAGIAA